MTNAKRRFFTQSGFSSKGRFKIKTYILILPLYRAFPVFLCLHSFSNSSCSVDYRVRDLKNHSDHPVMVGSGGSSWFPSDSHCWADPVWSTGPTDVTSHLSYLMTSPWWQWPWQWVIDIWSLPGSRWHHITVSCIWVLMDTTIRMVTLAVQCWCMIRCHSHP